MDEYEWIKSEEEEDLYFCSNCMSGFYLWTPDSSVEKMTKFYPTCPKCGVSMIKSKEVNHD